MTVLFLLLLFGYLHAETSQLGTSHVYSPPIPQLITPIEDDVNTLAEKTIKEFSHDSPQHITETIDLLNIPSEMDRETNKILLSLPSMRLSQTRNRNSLLLNQGDLVTDDIDQLASKVMKELKPMPISIIESTNSENNNNNPTPLQDDMIDLLAKKVFNGLPKDSSSGQPEKVVPLQADAVDKLAARVIQGIPNGGGSSSSSEQVTPLQADAVDKLATQVIQGISKDSDSSSDPVTPLQADSVDKLATHVIQGIQPGDPNPNINTPLQQDPVDLLALKVISESKQGSSDSSSSSSSSSSSDLVKDSVDNLALKVIQGVS